MDAPWLGVFFFQRYPKRLPGSWEIFGKLMFLMPKIIDNVQPLKIQISPGDWSIPLDLVGLNEPFECFSWATCPAKLPAGPPHSYMRTHHAWVHSITIFGVMCSCDWEKFTTKNHFPESMNIINGCALTWSNLFFQRYSTRLSGSWEICEKNWCFRCPKS